jgi:hypothetical protein
VWFSFVRRQSAGIGTMLALVRDGEVIGACIGDVVTQELYGFRPGSTTVHRISEFEVAERLAARRLIQGMDGVDVTGGSIGTQAARLWKGEVGVVLFPPSHETPWDVAPSSASASAWALPSTGSGGSSARG